MDTREHYLSVAIAKFAFRHAKYGIVFVRDPITLAEAAKHGLAPLVIYGLTPKGLPLRHIAFAAADRPDSICTFLQRAWREVSVLRGRPDVLRVNRHVASACPGLAEALKRAGVALVVTDGADKKFSASMRNIQDQAMKVGWRIRDVPVTSIETLNAVAAGWSGQYAGREVDENTQRWLAMPIVPLDVDLPDLPWKTGAWLHAWEATLPPAQPRYCYQGDGAVWLITGQPDNPTGADPGDDGGVEADHCVPIDNAASKAKLMVDAWPNPPVEIARAIDVTARELQWFLSEKDTLDDHRFELLALLGVEYIADYGEYEATGPCVLTATNRRRIQAAYDELSHGGDLQFAFEAVPDKGPADPSWRYLVFMACGGLPNIIMVPRGGDVERDQKNFLNFTGIRAISIDLYRDIVATSARACLNPTENVSAMMTFARRRYDQLRDMGD